MKKHIQKDLNRRLMVQKYEHKRIALKCMREHAAFSTQQRFLAHTQLSKLGANGSKVRTRSRCVITGRSRGIYNYFKISRIMIRVLASKGMLPGVRKASW